MTVNEFVELVKSEPLKWINYCEIIILSNGKIELAIPSHSEKLIEILSSQLNITTKELKNKFPKYLNLDTFICERCSCISVWYNYIIKPNKINRFQQHTLDILQKEKIINILKFKLANEYTWYLDTESYDSEFDKLLNIYRQ